jgi:beta-phosphoglucomutase family hydrolase
MVLIFDMDGVIVENHQWHFEAWAEFGRRHGFEITEASFTRFFGTTNQQVLSDLFGDKLTPELFITYSNEKETLYRELYRPHIQPLKGLPGFLHYVAEKGIAVALASSAPPENIEFTLAETGLKSYFKVITDSTQVTAGKPDPQVYLITAAQLGVEPSECVVFEDSVAGMQSATAAGMHVIGVSTTYPTDELLTMASGAIENFEEPERLLKLCEKLSAKNS